MHGTAAEISGKALSLLHNSTATAWALHLSRGTSVTHTIKVGNRMRYCRFNSYCLSTKNHILPSSHDEGLNRTNEQGMLPRSLSQQNKEKPRPLQSSRVHVRGTIALASTTLLSSALCVVVLGTPEPPALLPVPKLGGGAAALLGTVNPAAEDIQSAHLVVVWWCGVPDWMSVGGKTKEKYPGKM